MSPMKTLLAAAALALPITAFQVGMMNDQAVAKVAAKAKPGKKAKKVAKKSCGEYMYKKGGKCLDARAKAAK